MGLTRLQAALGSLSGSPGTTEGGKEQLWQTSYPALILSFSTHLFVLTVTLFMRSN